MFVKRFQNLVADKQVLDGTDILQIVTWNGPLLPFSLSSSY
jgi:hypothetical protein